MRSLSNLFSFDEFPTSAYLEDGDRILKLPFNKLLFS